jgi:hypothetical protein
VKITLEVLESLYPQLNHHVGVPTFLNGGCRPKQVNYEAEVTYTAAMACGTAEMLCPMLGRSLTVDHLMRYSRWLKAKISTLSRMLQQTKGELPMVGVSIAWFPDGQMVGTCSECQETIDLKTGIDLPGLPGVPLASYFISLTSLYLQTKALMEREETDKKATNVATEELVACQASTGERGVLRDNADHAAV